LEPGQRDNELHSILGTEFDSLGIDLEQYYTLYFSDDRRAVLAAAQQFDQAYTQKEDELLNIQNRIKQMRKQMQNDMDQNRMGDYNQLVPQINALIKEFNQKVRAYNALSRSLMGEETPANNQ
jgi:predicted  nucleic acid-binding Zn-ribbon protein